MYCFPVKIFSLKPVCRKAYISRTKPKKLNYYEEDFRNQHANFPAGFHSL